MWDSLTARNLMVGSMWAFFGLGAGFVIAFALSGRERSIARATEHHRSMTQTSAAYISTDQEFRNAISLYRSKQPRSHEDRLNFLKVIEVWLSRDPSDCVNSLREMGALGMLDHDLIIAAFTEEAERNLSVLAKEASEIQDPDLRDIVVRTLFDKVLASNPEGALDLLSILPVHIGHELQATLGRTVGAAGNSELFARLIKHPSVLRDTVITGLQAWISNDTPNALSFFDSISDGDLQRMRTSKSYILEKVRSTADPESLLTYVEKQPPSMAVTQAIAEATGTLLARDPSRWDELVGRQKSDATTSMIAANAAAKTVVKSPDAAAVFLSRINGLDARIQATKQTTRQFIFEGRGSSENVIAWARSINDPIIVEQIIEELRFQKMKIPEDFEPR